MQYVYIHRDHTLAKEPCVRFIYQSAALREASREKGTPLRKHTNKDTFRCLITIRSIGNARQGLNEHILHFFLFL